MQIFAAGAWALGPVIEKRKYSATRRPAAGDGTDSSKVSSSLSFVVFFYCSKSGLKNWCQQAARSFTIFKCSSWQKASQNVILLVRMASHATTAYGQASVDFG